MVCFVSHKSAGYRPWARLIYPLRRGRGGTCKVPPLLFKPSASYYLFAVPLSLRGNPCGKGSGKPQVSPITHKQRSCLIPQVHPNLQSYARQIFQGTMSPLPSFTRRPSLLTAPHFPIPLRPFIGRYFFARFHSKFFLKSPKKRTPRGYFKKYLRFVARLRATFGVFGGISERALIWVRDPRRGRGVEPQVSPTVISLKGSADYVPPPLTPNPPFRKD